MMTEGIMAKPAARGIAIACCLLAVIISGIVVFPQFASLSTQTGSCNNQMFGQLPPPTHCANTAAAAPSSTLATGFQESIAISGLTQPTSVHFAPDGKVFITQKNGIILVYDSLTATTPTVVADLRTEVMNFWDRGMMDLALDPNFPTSPYIYVLYAYDAPIGGTAPVWNDNCPVPPGPTTDGCVISSRLVRLTIDPSTYTMVPGSEKVIINAWCQQFPSHSTDDIAFGPDGALYLTAGEGGNYDAVDYGQYGGSLAGDKANPCGDPPTGVGGAETPPTAEGGALRSQSLLRNPGEPAVLNGSLLRIDVNTGDGLATNPNASSSDINARRIDAYGLRNPFRFTFRPGTNEVWIGDVGWLTWEEIDRVMTPTAPNQNFGWPCYEGQDATPSYQNAGLNICSKLYASSPSAVTTPYYTYNHSAEVVPGDGCPTANGSSITGIAFYQGSAYPEAYHGALFFTDYSRNCIWAMQVGSGGLPDPSKISLVVGGAGHPVDLETGPNDDLFYADLNDGQIRRITGLGPNAVATATTPTSGPSPLTVQFDGTQSNDTDPSATITSYSWDLDGDGVFGDSTSPTPSFTYNTEGQYSVRLQVTDSNGKTNVSTPVIVSVGLPPTPTIISPSSSLTWKVGDSINFSGSAVDGHGNPLPASALTWNVLVHHCIGTTSGCHIHYYQTFDGVASGSFIAPDHEYPSYIEVQLTATDPVSKLQTTTSVSIYPQTVTLTFQSSPAGALLSVDGFTGPTPFTYDVIVGSNNSVSAAPTLSSGGSDYVYGSWSDHGAQSHTILAGSSPATYTVNYLPKPNIATTWYFAEGYTGYSFSEYLTLANPNAATANVQVTYYLESGSPIIKTYAVPGNSRATKLVNSEAGANHNVSMVVTSDIPIIAERPMYFTYTGLAGYSIPGGTDVLGATSLGTQYDFGYLDTSQGHSTWLTILNQNSSDMSVTINYYPQAGGAPTTITHTVPANTRGTVYVNNEGLPAGTYGALVTLSEPGLVERPIYLVDSVTNHTGSADVVGVSAPLTNWYFAEGYTDPNFSERYMLFNPTDTTANATLTFLKSDGSKVPVPVTIAAGAQQVVDANSVLGSIGTNNSATVSSDQPIIAERFMSFLYLGQIPGATDVIGAPAPGNFAYFAEGYSGPYFSEYLVLENPDSTNTAYVQVTYLPSTAAAPTVQTYAVGPHSRYTILTNTVMPNQSFSMVVQSDTPIVAERPMYFNYLNSGQTGGTDIIGYQP